VLAWPKEHSRPENGTFPGSRLGCTFLSSIAVLALGIGGTTAAFSALYAVALRPLPYPKAQELVVVYSQFPRLQMNRLGVSPLDYLDLRKMNHAFSDAGAFFYLDLSRTGIDHAEKVNAVATTTSMFETCVYGRNLADTSQQAKNAWAAVMA
jgi:hypothetical protein